MTKIWRELVALAAFLVGVGAQFVEVPPEDNAAKPLTIFCVAVLVSIAYAAMKKWDNPSSLWSWAAVAVLCLGGVLLAHNYYANLFADVTVPYVSERRVIGTVLTPLGAAYLARYPHKSKADLYFDTGGNALQGWTEPSVRAAQNRLRYGYLLCAPLVGAAVVASTQVARLTRRRTRKPK